jgi:uncharacterized protein YndB with AHSA1/START domain
MLALREDDMTNNAPEQSGRTTEISIELAAPAETVGKTLTDAGELARWFPMSARVKPGVDGSIFRREPERRAAVAAHRRSGGPSRSTALAFGA